MSKIEKSFAGGNPLKADDLNQMVAAINDNDNQIASLREDTDGFKSETNTKLSELEQQVAPMDYVGTMAAYQNTPAPFSFKNGVTYTIKNNGASNVSIQRLKDDGTYELIIYVGANQTKEYTSTIDEKIFLYSGGTSYNFHISTGVSLNERIQIIQEEQTIQDATISKVLSSIDYQDEEIELVNTIREGSGLITIQQHFESGKSYKVVFNAESVATTLQIGTLTISSSSTYVDSTSVMSNKQSYIWEFVASANAEYIAFYVIPTTLFTINVYEIKESSAIERNKVNIANNTASIANINSILTDPKKLFAPIEIYKFKGKKDSLISASSWTQGGDSINLEATSSPFQDGAVVNKYFTIFNRKIIYDFTLIPNSIVVAYTQSADLEDFYKQGYCVSVNRETKTLNIHQAYGSNTRGVSDTLPNVYRSVPFTDVAGYGNYRLIIKRENRCLVASLYDYYTMTLLASVSSSFEYKIVPSYGLGYDYPAITITSGKIFLYSVALVAPNADNCNLYIIGDSITEGVPVSQNDAWAYKVMAQVPNTIVSGRGGGGLRGLMAKLDSEASILKPKYIMVTIGTNNYADYPQNSHLTELVSKIKDIGSIPIINCIPCAPYASSDKIRATINNEILALGEKCVRFDIATSKDYGLQEPDNTLYEDDLIHPNEAGHDRMYKRVLIDLPELFN